MSPGITVRRTAGDDYYVRNEADIRKIIGELRENHYCTILGPPYCQKTRLLKELKGELESTGDELCVLLNLENVEAQADEGFLGGFARALTGRLRAESIEEPVSLPHPVVDETSLQVFMESYLKVLQRDLILLLDHLERVHTGPLTSLLRVLRAERNTPHRLGIITASSFRLAKSILTRTSPPLSVAQAVLMRDLTSEESEELVNAILEQEQIEITGPARHRWMTATNGDRDLIPRLFRHCAKRVRDRGSAKIAKKDVEEAIQSFVTERGAAHRPFLESVRAIETDPTILDNVLKILKVERVRRSALKLEQDAEIDDLQLTGAVRVETGPGGKIYCIRNEMYERNLERHFLPEQVARVFGMAGKWHRAIPYLLEQTVEDTRQHRSVIQGMMVNSIYAAPNVAVASQDLAKVLGGAFSIPKVRVYLADLEKRESLQLYSQRGLSSEEENALRQFSLRDENRAEVRVYFEQDYAVTGMESGERVLLIPLLRPLSGDTDHLGLVAVHGFDADPQRQDFLDLLAFLQPFSKALGSVIDRERQMKQLRTLNSTVQEITARSLDLGNVLNTTVERAVEAVPAAQKGSLFLMEEVDENGKTEKKLVIQALVGFQDTEGIAKVMKLRSGEGYAGWVYEQRQPLLLDNVFDDERTVPSGHPEISAEKSAIAVPLEAWGVVFGVLCLDNSTAYRAFRDTDLELLSTFGRQAAVAIHNARLYRELSRLGMEINREELDEEDIFRRTVESICLVSGAKAANVIWVDGDENPSEAVVARPIQGISLGLGDWFDSTLAPRETGLTRRVLEVRAPLAVTYKEGQDEPQWACALPSHRPDDPAAAWLNEPPQIYPHAVEQGIRAYLALPMMIREEEREIISGVLFVHHQEPHDFSDNELELLSLFANQAALAIENARQRRKLELAKTVALMGLTFSQLKHRFNQNLACLEGWLVVLRTVLEQQGNLNEDLQEILQEARGEVKDAYGILKEPPLRTEEFDLNAAIREELTRYCAAHPVSLELDGLTSEDAIVKADRVRLAFVLHVLASNAVRAMKEAGVWRLDVRSVVHRQRVVVLVRNSGSAIQEEILEDLLVRPIDRRHGTVHSGVGLIIARAYMMECGGDIRLVETGPEGTTFALWLPLRQRSGVNRL